MALNPIEGQEEWEYEFPDESLNLIEADGWKLYFDGAVNHKGAGVGAILITPEGESIPFAKKLDFKVTNNMAEYEACIFGLEAVIATGAKNLTVYGDSMLIINQASENWEVKDEKLKPYAENIQMLTLSFSNCTFAHLPRDENQMADALATLASMWDNPRKVAMKPLVMCRARIPCYQGERVMTIIGPKEKSWFYDILKFLEKREYPEGANGKQKHALRISSRSYTYHDGVLYRRALNGILLRCLDRDEA